jgi:hypothetical protein
LSVEALDEALVEEIPRHAPKDRHIGCEDTRLFDFVQLASERDMPRDQGIALLGGERSRAVRLL